jgi:hypothetical protein
MANKELRFRIEGTTPHTLPMRRLAEYMKNLALLYGSDAHVHFLRMDEGSATCVSEVDEIVEQEVIARTKDAVLGKGAKEAVKSYGDLGEMLEDDDWRAEITTEEGDLLAEFAPRAEQDEQVIGPLWQEGALDGLLTRIEGVDETIHITLISEEHRRKAQTSRIIGMQLGPLFYKPIRVFGRGKWFRTAHGKWELEKFIVQNFEAVDDESLPEIVSRLRSIPDNDLKKLEDPIGEMLKLRHGEE